MGGLHRHCPVDQCDQMLHTEAPRMRRCTARRWRWDACARDCPRDQNQSDTTHRGATHAQVHGEAVEMGRLRKALEQQAGALGQPRQLYTPRVGQPVHITHQAQHLAKVCALSEAPVPCSHSSCISPGQGPANAYRTACAAHGLGAPELVICAGHCLTPGFPAQGWTDLVPDLVPDLGSALQLPIRAVDLQM